MKRDESSANNRMLDDMLSVRSFIYIRNISGPRTDPCGTPDKMGSHNDSYHLTQLFTIFWKIFYMKMNASKCHLLIGGDKSRSEHIFY